MDDENSNAAPGAAHVFNEVFLIFCLVAVVLTILFLLYSNRLFAWIVARGLRTWTWRRHRVYIDFQALQISLLGGRVFFTGLRYHGPNETFFVQNGHITWRYWLRRVRDVDVGKEAPKTEETVEKVSGHQDNGNSKLPCRINVSLNGLEWFVYNRAPVYDGVLRNLTEDDPTRDEYGVDSDISNKPGEAEADTGSVRRHGKEPSSSNVEEYKDSDDSSQSGSGAGVSDLPVLLQLFPIHVNCRTAAVVMGNDNTKAVLVIKTHDLSGEVDASGTDTSDPYRQIFKVNFRHPVIEMKRNEDYREDQESRATKDKKPPQDASETKPRSSFFHRHRKLRRRLRNMVPLFRKSVESFSPSETDPAPPPLLPGENHWQGLSRYLQDDMEDKARWASVEYAANPTIIDSPSATLTIFWDVPGKVGSVANSAATPASPSQDINGDKPPAWGMHLAIQGGVANYGPWADRQRAELQRFFFPSLSKDASPAKPLKEGQYRLSTKFNFYVELDKEVTIRIPTREPSKNWRYKDKNPQIEQNLVAQRQTRKERAREKKTEADEATRIRPAGWLELKVAANATISYNADMVPGQSGYSSTVDIELPETELSTSVNHELLWRSKQQRISCDLSTPLTWNTLRTWGFDVSSENLELFLLRDHVFLLIDLVDDWTTGPTPDYLVFTPFKYNINLDFTDVKVYFNVNDSNIINNPTSMDENTFIVFSSQALHAGICIPINAFRPTKNAIPFDIRAESFGVDLNLPLSNTQATFLRTKTIGQAESIVVDGRYHYNATTSPANTDTLVLDLIGQSPTFTAYGFTIRYFLGLKDNYFGDHIHFKTLEEYQESLRRESGSEAQTGKPPYHPSNDLDVILGVRIDDPRLLLPRNLYDASHNIQVETPSLGADLRFTNYYMDLDLSISPLSLSLGTEEQPVGTPTPVSASTQVFVDGLRIYGHRLFGLPPTEPTYLCNWDLSVGAVSGECTAEFLTTLARGAQAFIFDFDDEENALIPYSSIIMHDVTFLRLVVHSVRVWLHVDEAAFLLSTESISLNFNDWARTHYSKRANVRIPSLQLSCVDSEVAARHKSRHNHDISPEALLQTSIRLAVIGRKFEFSNERKSQQELIRREDQRTLRTQFLLLPELLGEFTPDGTDPPAQCVPPVPTPATEADIADEGMSAAPSGLSARIPSIRRQSSFLTLSSSSGRSVIRTSPSRSRSRGNVSDPQTEQPGSRPGELSTSSEHHSAFYSAKGEHGHGEPPRTSAVTFSSQYYAPHFPLKNLNPDNTGAAVPLVEEEDDVTGPVGFDLEDIDPEILSEDHAYNSFIVEFPTGISCLLTPLTMRYTTSLLTALQPSSPEDVLDEIQVGSMTELIDLKQMVKVKGEVKDLMVRLPSASVRFLNSPAAEYQKAADQSQDQYDITVNNVAFVARETAKWEDPYLSETRVARRSLHLRLDSLEATAVERFPDVDEVEAAVMVQVENTVVSTGSRDLTYIDAQIGAVRGTTNSSKIEYLASLVHRTSIMASEIGELFSEVLSKNADRPKLLVHKLACASPHAGEASFFTRPSAILRSAEDHLRSFDSWKLILRLRQIWSDLNAEEREQIYLELWGTHPALPENAVQEVIAAFQKWRSWDLGNLSESVVLNNIFGPSKEKRPVPSSVPLLAACQVGEVEMVLDPGPKENKTTVLDVSVRVEQNRERQGASEGLPDVEGPLTAVNIYCGDGAVKVNWELCEMANRVLRLYARNLDEQKPEPSEKPKEKKTPSSGQSRALHVAFSVARGSVAVDTVNLKAKTLTHGLTASLLVHSSDADITATNFLIACDGITSRLHSHSQLLGMVQLRQPSIFASHEVQSSDSVDSHTVKSTASCKDLALAVKQDPIALLEVADLLVKDELAQLYRLNNQLPQSDPEPQRPGRRIAERLSAYRVNVALFLDEYNISVPLLQSLTYNISGVVSRAAMAANFGREVIFDFDISENSHEIQIDVNNEPRGISLLSIPPTNGRITSLIGDGEHSVTLFASIELIQLDAAAVYSLLGALNRPEITNTIGDVQEQVKIIKGHLDDIIDTDVVTEAAVNSRPKSELVYTLHLTMAGLEIFGTTRLGLETLPAAHVLACIDRMHFEMSNRVEARGPVLEHPELHVHLGKILLDLQRGREGDMKSCGSVAFSAFISATTKTGPNGQDERAFGFRSDGFEVNLSPDTVSTLMYVLNHLGEKIKDLDTSREMDYLRKLRQSKPKIAINGKEEAEEADIIDSFLSSFVYQFEVHNARLSWLIADPDAPYTGKEDLVLSVGLFEFGTRKTKSARLTIQNFQVQMVPPGFEKHLRSHHSALMPEIIFNVAYFSTADARRLAFQAVGKALDIRLTSGFIMPASDLKDSLVLSMENLQQASQNWNTGISTTEKTEETASMRSILGGKRLESLLADVDFAGAVVHLSAKKTNDPQKLHARLGRSSGGKYGQFSDDAGGSVSLRSPGLAVKMEYRDDGKDHPALSGEIKVEGSSNILHPTVVPLVLDITSGIKEVVSRDADKPTTAPARSPSPKPSEGDGILSADTDAVLGRLKLNMGLRICKQEFTLSCQPIARVAASTQFEDIYLTVNTVRSNEAGNFLAVSAAISGLQTSVQHVYSRESTGSFEVDSIVLSLMNSKHFSGKGGVSAILKFSPMKVAVNAKQLQDFLLFREIWYPAELRQESVAPVKLQTESSQGHLVQRYQQVAATAAFPWTATVSISAVEINMDLGQAIGKTVFAINDFWVSSKKTSDWEQNLTLGFSRVGADCTGRLSGFIALQDFRLRSQIQWPEREQALNETPLVQASISFSEFRLKAAFDYQAFLIADITSIEFLMYNVRRAREGSGDRLVAIFDGKAIQVFGTPASAALGVSLYQAMQKLIQERKGSFETSLREIERFMKRKSPSFGPSSRMGSMIPKLTDEDTLAKSPISLDTDVVVTLKALNLGVFSSTFSDQQVFKMEALDAQARFAANIVQRRIHSILDLTLGQLRIGLATVREAEGPRTLTDLSVEDVVQRATGSRGGTILKVPRVHAAMETWQSPKANRIEYIFKSAFEGKVEVGWNYSRISYIRGMWANHTRMLQQTWGKELAVTAIRVTGVPTSRAEDEESGGGGKGEQNKITAEVNVPQSKYEYLPLEDPVIETPRLKEMGEATPPLEWIGLHRERLPNLTHQIVIVALLELAGEVEDAYGRIMGSS